MAKNPAQPLNIIDRLKQVSNEQAVGGYFEGESKRERKVGKEREVVVDIFKRPNTTFFMRVSLRSMINPNIISRFEIDLSRYSTEKELLHQAYVGGGSVAIADIENRGATWDPEYVAQQAMEAARELLKDINQTSFAP